MMEPDVIVIGGSAGALEVLLAMLPELPPELATPVAICLHVHPSGPSLVPHLLGEACPGRTAVEADDKQPLAPNGMYVAPPNYHMMLERTGHIALSVDAPVHFSRPSIDVLFDSAAEAFGPGVVGVLLSGANEDGAEGLASIHAKGGTALVQDPLTAAYSVMPNAALQRIGTGAKVLGVPELAQFFRRYVQREHTS